MSKKHSTFEIKLSPTLSVLLAVFILIGGGVVYVVKPSWFETVISQTSSGSVLTKSQYYPEIEENLKIYLKGAVIKHLAERSATQAEFDAAEVVKIIDILAEPLRYYRTELDFWKESDQRNVTLWIDFTCGNKTYSSKGEMTVSGVANNISLSDVKLIHLPTEGKE